MEIRIRHEGQDTGMRFCDSGVGEVESVMASIKRSGGVYFEGEHCNEMSHQFVLDESGAYCEIVLHDSPETGVS